MTLEDLLEIESIKQLRIKYSHFFDGKRIDELADLFTEDAVCEFGQDYGGDWAGKEVIKLISKLTPTARVLRSGFCMLSQIR